MPSVFISDGMNFADVVPELPGVYPAVEYRYRPVPYEEQLDAHVGDARERARKAGDLLCKKVLEFKADGEIVQLTADNALKLHPGIINHVLNRVLGFAGPARDVAKN